MILDRIVAKKRTRLDQKMKATPLDEIRQQAYRVSKERRGFKDGLTSHPDISIIGEIKKASPSKGLIKPDFDPASLATQYAGSDVQALSVLTEQDFFLGDDAYLKEARKHCTLPVLRKDFIIDEWQIYESALMGADAILLIVAILDDTKLEAYLKTAKELNLDALVEVHDQEELNRALSSDAPIIGINNRNLNDFSVSLQTTESLVPSIPKDKVIVGESGIHTPHDVMRMRDAGVHALLIGESLMRAPSIPETVDSLRSQLV